jgi:hypothetical protein
MTAIEARNAPKVSFPKIVANMNNRRAISAEQRVGRGKRLNNVLRKRIARRQ